MGRHCSKGKSCGATCIYRRKICEIDLNAGPSSQLEMVKGNLEGRLKPKFENSGQVDDHYNARIDKLRSRGKDPSDLIRERELTKKRLPKVNSFLEELSSNLPKGAEAVNNGGIININFKTRSNDLVEASFSPRLGFHFRVNGQVSAGSVKTEEGKMQVSRAAALIFASITKSLPEGSVVKTRPHKGDGREDKLTSIYKRSGFSDPTPPKGLMFAIKTPEGKMIPATQEQYDAFSKSAESVFFREMLHPAN